MIRVDRFSYRYPGKKDWALQEITLQIPEGQFCAVVGANSAGKSSLCLALSGFIPHYYHGKLQGSVTVAGVDIEGSSLAELSGEIGLVFQNPFNQITGARMSVRDEVAFGLENLGVPREEMLPRIIAALELTGLEDLADRSPFSLSGGQQQRLAIASVLVMEPRVLILDEPTAQLDPVGSREVFAALDELTVKGNTTIVLVSHKLEWVAQFADRVIALSKGSVLLDGKPEDVLTSDFLPEHGVGLTHYTRAAQLAQAQEINVSAPLPVTLDQAKHFFQ